MRGSLQPGSVVSMEVTCPGRGDGTECDFYSDDFEVTVGGGGQGWWECPKCGEHHEVMREDLPGFSW